MEEFEKILANTRFCRGMDPRHVGLLAGGARECRVDGGEFVFHEGEDARLFYIINTGRVSLEVSTPERGAILFQTIGAGDALGLSWLFPPYQWHFDARAVEAAEMFSFEAAWLRRRLEEDHDFGYEILKRVAQVMINRLQATRLQMTDMYGEQS